MKEFLSTNGIKMIEGYEFNWEIVPVYIEQEQPIVYVIYLGSIATMYGAQYNPETKILSLCDTAYSSYEVFKFHCETIKDAETIVTAFVKANDIDMSHTIYKTKVML